MLLILEKYVTCCRLPESKMTTFSCMRNVLVALVLMTVTDKQLDQVLLKNCFNGND
jgi:hypothetical protein